MFKYIKNDLPASIVVFFVALPLCLGIALASGAPLFSGLIAGIIGGIVVGFLSGSQIGVSGPAAGLAAIVLVAISALGSYENFLAAVVLGGVIQIVFGILKAGVIGNYFPSSVIKGMLTGIGILIIIKQIPHFFGYNAVDGAGFSFDQVSQGATLIGVVSLTILIVWDNVLAKKAKIFKLVQGPLVAVVVGIILFTVLGSNGTFGIPSKNLVSVPVPDSIDSFLGQFSFPNFEALANPNVWITAFTIALVASLETLLCVEATDKLDPDKRVTPTNRELLAQGTGNVLSGLIGGLPITQVIVRSSANVQSGGKTKMSAIVHGFFLLISVVTIPKLLNMIPLSVLAAILLIVGYKLAKPKLFKEMYSLGWKQSIPFAATVLGIVFTDLLTGICLGLVIGIAIILIKSYQNSHQLQVDDAAEVNKKVTITLAEEVTFFNKNAIFKELNSLTENSHVELDVRKTRFLDHDIVELLDNFSDQAKSKNISVKLISERGTIDNPDNYLNFFKQPTYNIQ